jgi:hypothetical protein
MMNKLDCFDQVLLTHYAHGHIDLFLFYLLISRMSNYSILLAQYIYGRRRNQVYFIETKEIGLTILKSILSRNFVDFLILLLMQY